MFPIVAHSKKPQRAEDKNTYGFYKTNLNVFFRMLVLSCFFSVLRVLCSCFDVLYKHVFLKENYDFLKENYELLRKTMAFLRKTMAFLRKL